MSLKRDLYEKTIHGIADIYESPLVKNIARALEIYGDIGYDFQHAFSKGQIDSKKWLVNNSKFLIKEHHLIYIVGSWIGLLPAMMFLDENLKKCRIRCFDKDEMAIRISERINKEQVINNWQFKATKFDMFDIDYSLHKYQTVKNYDDITAFHVLDYNRLSKLETAYLEEQPDVIINTSCEHINLIEWMKLIPSGKLVILQSNNFYEAPGHINCVKSEDELSEQANLSIELYRCRLNLDNYTRFMVIGYK